MKKLISFVILVLVTGAFGVLFFEVTSTLLLPLFLAMVSVVMFRPVYTWIEQLLSGRNRVAGVITTALVLMVVVVPSVIVLVLAGNEAAKLVRSLDDGEFRDKLQRARLSLGLEYPHVAELRFAERSFERLLADTREGTFASGNRDALERLHEELRRLQVTLNKDGNSPRCRMHSSCWRRWHWPDRRHLEHWRTSRRWKRRRDDSMSTVWSSSEVRLEQS